MTDDSETEVLVAIAGLRGDVTARLSSLDARLTAVQADAKRAEASAVAAHRRVDVLEPAYHRAEGARRAQMVASTLAGAAIGVITTALALWPS